MPKQQSLAMFFGGVPKPPQPAAGSPPSAPTPTPAASPPRAPTKPSPPRRPREDGDALPPPKRRKVTTPPPPPPPPPPSTAGASSSSLPPTSPPPKPAPAPVAKPSPRGKGKKPAEELTPEAAAEAEARRKANARRFMASRGQRDQSAIRPGCKDLPQGDVRSLEGLTFCVTGRLESTSRDEAHGLIMQHGGQIRGNISGKTSYIVVGEEPGEGKTRMAKEKGTKELTEDTLIELIAARSAARGTDPWAWKGGSGGGGGASQGDDDEELELIPAVPTSPPSLSLPTSQPDSPSYLSPSTLSSPSVVPASSSPPLVAPTTLVSRPTRVAPSSSFPSPSGSSSVPTELPPTAMDYLWCDKYRPRRTAEMVGGQYRAVAEWLQTWKVRPRPADFKRAALLSGLPGIGKTTAAHNVGREMGFEVVEWNASDKRNKGAIESAIGTMVTNTSVSSMFSKTLPLLIVMDEVDGCDRGGVGEVIAMIKATKVPIICICNERHHPKLKSLAGHCKDIRFSKPNQNHVAQYLVNCLKKEGLDMQVGVLAKLVEQRNGDIRSVLNTLQIWFRSRTTIDYNTSQRLQAQGHKDHEVGIFDAPGLFLEPQSPPLPMRRLNELFYSVDFLPLYIQENYISMIPRVSPDSTDRLRRCAEAAESISLSDHCNRLMFSEQSMQLSNSHVFLSTIYPASLVRGRFEPHKRTGSWADSRLRFPMWLGNNSSQKKHERLVTSVARQANNPVLAAQGARRDVRLDYFPLFAHHCTAPLVQKGKDGIDEVIQFMDNYHLLRDDWELLQEITKTKADIDSVTKGAFTRRFNTTHQTVSAAKAAATAATEESAAMLTDAPEEARVQEVAEDEEEDQGELEADALIVKKRTPKPKAKRAAAGGGGGAAKPKAKRKPAGKGKPPPKRGKPRVMLDLDSESD